MCRPPRFAEANGSGVISWGRLLPPLQEVVGVMLNLLDEIYKIMVIQFNLSLYVDQFNKNHNHNNFLSISPTIEEKVNKNHE